ncbi:hypothetical protein CVU75_00465 [Candidatus Dependentiae bacterium HGW-Dependentiae-1]|nr:MAG: hypothetical protein CVU75_00465 [Candidatus Dependentiae bacterium HGW-Dependentiae-1]
MEKTFGTPARYYALYSSHIETPLGTMLAIADNTSLYLLEFTDRTGLNNEIQRLLEKTKATLTPEETAPLMTIESELQNYFAGTLKKFTTPLFLSGSPFQKTVWLELQKNPYGQTRSYKNLATAVGNPNACRAVAQANGANQLAIIIPCHRVINANGNLGGYSGSAARKKWLITHEKQNS